MLDRFVEVGLIDDVALALAYTSSRQSEQGLARRAIAMMLRQRGVDDDVVAAATATVEPDDELAAARRLVAKRLPVLAGLDRAVRTRRLVGLLGRKGYPAGMAYRVVAEALSLDEAIDHEVTDHEDTDHEDTDHEALALAPVDDQ
ncbi:MAG: regulatory protein RecX [Janthinobacterium lividum]